MSKFAILMVISLASLLASTISASAYAHNRCGGFMSWPCPAGQHCQLPKYAGSNLGVCVPNRKKK
jgi:hypothetical protein